MVLKGRGSSTTQQTQHINAKCIISQLLIKQHSYLLCHLPDEVPPPQIIVQYFYKAECILHVRTPHIAHGVPD